MRHFNFELMMLVNMVVGFISSLLKSFYKFQAREKINLFDYLTMFYKKFIVSFLLALGLLIGGIIDESINGVTALLIGYSSENIFRFVLDKTKIT